MPKKPWSPHSRRNKKVSVALTPRELDLVKRLTAHRGYGSTAHTLPQAVLEVCEKAGITSPIK